MKRISKRTEVKPSTLGWPEDWSLEEIGMSQSLWDTYCSCKRAFLFKINGYSQPLKEEKVHFGNIVHEVNDKVYSHGRIPSTRVIGRLVDDYTNIVIKRGTLMTHHQLEMDAAKAHATMSAYFQVYKDDFKTKRFTGVERTFEIMYNGCMQRGKIDGNFLSNRKKWNMEHKTKGRISEHVILLRLPLDFQNLFYLLNDELETGVLATGVLYNVVRNLQLKLCKNEKVKDYYKRIYETCMADPAHSFKRWESIYTPVDHKLFRKDLDYLIADMKKSIGKPVHPNRFNCDGRWTCEFLRVCSEDSLASLTKSKEKPIDYIFPELKGPDNASEKSKCSSEKIATRKIATRKRAKRRK